MTLLSQLRNGLTKWLLVLSVSMFFVSMSSVDIFAEAYNPITLDTGYTFTHNGTDTWYSFDLIKGQGISVELNHHFSSGYVACYLYDSEKISWNSITNAGPSYTPAVKVMSFNAQTTGTYYLKVTGSGAGDYDLRIHNAWYNPGVSDSGRAFSSSLATAKYIATGLSYAFNAGAGKVNYRFIAKQGTPVSVKLTHHFSTGSANIAFYDKYGVRFVDRYYVGVGYAGNMTVSFTAPKDDVYFFSVYTNGSAIVGTYDMEVSGAEPDADSDGDSLSDAAEYYHGTDANLADTNDNGNTDPDELKLGRNPIATRDFTTAELTNAMAMSNAIPLRLNEVATGTATGSDIWHYINLKKDQKVTFVITSRFPSEISPYLFNSADLLHYVYLFNTVNGYSPFSSSRNIDWYGYTAPADGVYFVKIPASSASGALGSYDIAVFSSWHNPGTLDSDRINRTQENAGSNDSDRIFHSSMYTAQYLKNGSYPFPTREGHAYFRFSAVSGVPVSITLGADLTLGIVQGGILDAGGSKVTAQCSSGYSCTDSSYLGPDYQSQFSMTFTPPASGDYYFHVYSNGTTNGTYTLVANGTEPPAEIDDHGNGMSDATVVGDNSQTSGKIQNELYATYDEDVFKFTATQNGLYTIYTTGALDTYGQVCDATGQACDSDDDSGAYPNFLIRKMMSAGEVAYVGVTSQLASGGYTVHVDPPMSFPSPPVGAFLFTPVYPAVATKPSTVMQGGKVKRIYRLLSNLPNLPVVPDVELSYQVCTTTILGTDDCGAEKKTPPSDKDGYIVFETEWITDLPGTTVNRFIKLLDSGIVNTIPPSFDVTVYPRSLQQEFGWSAAGSIGGGGALGGGVGIASASAFEIGAEYGSEWSNTIKLDTNEFGTSYRSKTAGFVENTTLATSFGFSPSFAPYVKGPTIGFAGQKTEFGGSVNLKAFGRFERNDKYPDFFSTDPLKASNVAEQATGLAARLYETLAYTTTNNILVREITKYLFEKTGVKDFRDEESYSYGISGKAAVGTTLKTALADIELVGFSDEITLSNTTTNSFDKSRRKEEVKFSHSFDVSMLNFKLGKLPLKTFKDGETLFASMPIKPSFATGGNVVNEASFKDGDIDSIKLSMTTSTVKVDSGIPTFGSFIAEKSITAYTNDPAHASLLYNNGVGVKTLLGVGLLSHLPNSLGLTTGLAGDDLMSILEYKNATGLWDFIDKPLEYYNSLTVTEFHDLKLHFDAGAGVVFHSDVSIGSVDKISQIESKGVSIPDGHFETEEYQLNDSYVSSKTRGMSDIEAVYNRLITEAINAVINKVNGAIDSGLVYLGDLADGGIAAVKKVGDSFNWLNYKIHLATTKGILSGQSMLAMQSPAGPGMTAAQVALAADTALTIGQNHFVNIQDPSGVDIKTFPAPITISIGYKLADLTAAGLTAADAGYLRIYRWDDAYGVWGYAGGTVNTATQSVSVDIAGKGSFILAIDKVPPAVTNFVASNTTTMPTLTATIKDSLSGINTDSFSMMLDGATVINSTNWQSYFNKATGQFSYKPTTGLAVGNHAAILKVSDSAGNLSQTTLNFAVNAPQMTIAHIPLTGANAGSPILITASVPDTVSITEAWLAYRLDHASYKYLPLIASGSTYSATISSVETNGKQMSYYLFFKDSNGTEAYSPAQAPAATYLFALNGGATRTLNITLDGLGSGSIQAPGLVCDSGRCTGAYGPGTSVLVTPLANTSSVFGGWSGEACSEAGPCTVTMITNVNLTAHFYSKWFPVNLAFFGTGGGSVNSNPTGIACTNGNSAGCSELFSAGTPVTLIPLANSASLFAGWSGACTNSNGNCNLAMNGAKNVTATFTAAPRVKVAAKEFTTVQGAYGDGATLNNAVIKLLEGSLAESVIFGRNISVTLDGGYDAAYGGVSSETTIDGSLKVRSGTVRARNVNVK